MCLDLEQQLIYFLVYSFIDSLNAHLLSIHSMLVTEL